MSGTDETELNRIREEYGDLMNEEDKEHFPTAQEQAKKRVEQREKREKEISRIDGWISTFRGPWTWSASGSFAGYSLVLLACMMYLWVTVSSWSVDDVFSKKVYVSIAIFLNIFVLNRFRVKSVRNPDLYKKNCAQMIVAFSVAFLIGLFHYSLLVAIAVGVVMPCFFAALLYEYPVSLRPMVQRVDALWMPFLLYMTSTDLSNTNELADFNKTQSRFILFFLCVLLTSLMLLMMLPGGGPISISIYLFLLYTVLLLSMRDVVRWINDDDQSTYEVWYRSYDGRLLFAIAMLFYMYFGRKVIARVVDLSDAPAVFIPVFVFLSSVFFCDEIYAFFFMNKIKSLENEREML